VSESTEIDRRPVTLGAPMTDLDGAYRLAKALAMASVMPDALRGKPSDVLALIMYGQDLGMSPMQAIQSIYVVKGKPQLSATGWIALAQRQGYRIVEIESTVERATVEISHPGRPDRKPHRETYTLERAAKAGLCRIGEDGKAIARSSKGDPLPWEAHTQVMLRNRALTTAAKFYCPEVALGFDIEGSYDYIPDHETVVEVAPPEVVEDAVVVEPEKVAEEVASLVGQYDFTAAVDADVVEAEVPADYECLCGAVGKHFEDECPKAAADA
jgi:hypothetical protein